MTEKVIKKFNVNGLTIPIDESKITELNSKVRMVGLKTLGEDVKFEFGGVDTTSGELISNTIRCRSERIYIDKSIRGKIELNYSLDDSLIISFASNQAGSYYGPASYAYLGTTPIKNIPDIYMNGGVVSFVSDGTFDNIIISAKHADESNISESELLNCRVYNTNSVAVTTESNKLKLESIPLVKSSTVSIAEGIGNVAALVQKSFYGSDSCIVNVYAGKKYRIVGVGGYSSRLWALVDKETHVIIDCADATTPEKYLDTPFDIELIPENDCLLVINCYNERFMVPYGNLAEIPYKIIGYFDVEDIYRINRQNLGFTTEIDTEPTSGSNSLVTSNLLAKTIVGKAGFEYGGINSLEGNLIDFWPEHSTDLNTIRIRTKSVYFSQGEGTKSLSYYVPPTLIPAISTSGNYASWAYLDSQPIKSIPDLIISTLGLITFTADGTFNNIRISFKHSDESPITKQELAECYVYSDTGLIQQIEEAQKVNNYKGKLYCALGDSITYGYIPRNYTGYPGQLNSYALLTAKKLGMDFMNFGISGSTVAQHPSRNPMSVRYTDLPDNADVITVMGGTNDVRNGIPLGTMNDRDNSTYYGALYVLMQGLYTKYIEGVDSNVGKTKKIVILTPIKLLDADKSNLENTIQNNSDVLYKWDEWINAVKEVAAFYSFPVLDMYNLSGINPHLNRTLKGNQDGYNGYYNPYITDGTHPTQEGAEIMSDVLVGFLKTIK